MASGTVVAGLAPLVFLVDDGDFSGIRGGCLRERLEPGLLVPKSPVGTSRSAQLVMGTGLDDASIGKDVDTPGVPQRREAVGDHDYGLGICELPHQLDDGRLALGVNVGSRLVQDVHRRVVQERSCHRQPLTLATGEVRPFGGHRGLQATCATHEPLEATAVQDVPELFVRGIGFCQAQV